MKQEDKLLLLNDLSARLLYGVQLRIDGDEYPKLWRVESDCINGYPIDKFDIKPYLRLLSSMTEEERKELCEMANISDINKHFVDFGTFLCETSPMGMNCIVKLINYLNAHHFDYRGLIPKGLALEAPEGMYN